MLFCVYAYVETDEFHPCESSMPLYIKTVANSTLPEDTQMSESISKRHDKPAINSLQSTTSSQSSSRTSSNSSDTLATTNSFGSVKRKGSKSKGIFLTKSDKKASERSPSCHQRNDTSRCSVLDIIKCPVETSRPASTGVIQTSALATNTKSNTSTLSSSGKSAWMHRRRSSEVMNNGNLIYPSMANVASRQPQAANIPECSSSDSNITNSSTSVPVSLSYVSLQRRTSAPVLSSSRMVSAGVDYAASVKANLSSTAVMHQQPSSSSDVISSITSQIVSSNTITLSTTNVTTTASVTDSDSNTYALRASASVAKPMQDTSGDGANKPTGPQNLVAAADSINLILQDLDSAANMKKAATSKGKPTATEITTTDPDQYVSEGMDSSYDIDVLTIDEEWENIDMSSLSNECNTDDDKISEFSILHVHTYIHTYVLVCVERFEMFVPWYTDFK